MEDEQEQQEEQQGQEQQAPLRKRKGNLRDIAPVNYARKSNK